MSTRTPHPSLNAFQPPTRDWFTASFQAPTRAQELAWPKIAEGDSTLILAPTGSGKTLAAFLAAIDHLMFTPVPPKEERCRVLYISPLKALGVDVERNLRAPLVGVSRYAERQGAPFHAPEVAIRTGDTPSKERAAFQRHPADILITTPESLFLLLTSNARDALRSVRWVIVDEIHTMVGTKRGAHLALSLERLEALCGHHLQRIGLSATVRPGEEAARFLGGYPPQPTLLFAAPLPVGSDLSEQSDASDEEAADRAEEAEAFLEPAAPEPAHRVPRPVSIVDAGNTRRLELTVEVPVENMARLGEVVEIPSGSAAQGEVRTSIWPAIHPYLLDLVKKHRTTLIFVNSRRLAERIAQAMNELEGSEIVRAHHGSLAREQRLQIEEDLKAGRLPGLVATSTLELGIDMGSVDLVIQVEAPPSVASGIQRVGRAGHQIDSASEGILVPKFRGDLLACAALTERMLQGAVEPLRMPRNPLDVLAQHIVSMVALDEWTVDGLETLVRTAAPFVQLPRSQLEGVLDMLSGRYPSDDFAELRPRLTWDRLAGTLRSREGAKRLAIANAGTIPDRGLFPVYLAGADEGPRAASARVGELDEEMVFESHPGETFILGATTWRIENISHDRVTVVPAPGEPGRMPFWKGESAGRTLEFGRAIGRLCRTLRELPREEAAARLRDQHRLTDGAARNLLQYLDDQAEATGAVPDDRTLVVERYVDEMGDWRVCVLSPFGGKVHAPWAMAIAAQLAERLDTETDMLWTDDGIVVRFPEADEPPPIEWVLPDPEEVEDLITRRLGSSALFAGRFREAAGRALLLPRRHPGQRKPLWQQRRRASDLLRTAAEYGSFPIILETYRECLQDVFDVPALVTLLREIRQRSVRTVVVETRIPSPFAGSLLFNYIGNFMYEGDAPLAERRAQALAVDQTQLRELLGQVELRELLDAEALEEIELQLQHLTPERRARHADGLHDLLLRLGDMSEAEVRQRTAEAPEGWLAELERARRIVRLPIAGEVRYIAAEDAGRYRDALGIPPPQGLPMAFLEYLRDPLGDLVARYARTHGPFLAEECAGRLGIGLAPIQTALAQSEAAGRVSHGEFRPGGIGREWCDVGVLRQLRQKSLARLRKAVEPVEPAALGRLYLGWQNITSKRRGPDALIEVIEQLQGCALAASELESRILPARLESYQAHDLDALTASGAVLWTGAEALGEHDGRVRLYLAENASLLYTPKPPGEAPDGKLHQALRQNLQDRGASFFVQLVQACGGAPAIDVQEALWDLVWAGEVTNDTLQPLRAYLYPRRRAGRSSGYRLRALRTRATFPPETAGRWSLVSSLLFSAPTQTQKLAALSRQLLDRYGVLTREAVQSEGVIGGFSSLYPVLRGMEEAGQIRRGYFVAGRGAAQFAQPGALDRLRNLRESPEEPVAVVLAATDPANPYGAAIPWPPTAGSDQGSGRRASRSAGAIVIVVDGALVAWMGRGERNLITFPDQYPELNPDDVREAITEALAAEVRSGGRRALFVREVDGRPAAETDFRNPLRDAGFTYGPHGFMLRS